jgi:RHH-type transcriptional regulator, rel operon repressor / antitoxin RelB
MAEAITDKPLNVRLPLDLADQLDALTKATGKTKSFLTIEALREYLEVQAWQVQDIQDALVDADQGKFASEKEVAEFFGKYER